MLLTANVKKFKGNLNNGFVQVQLAHKTNLAPKVDGVFLTSKYGICKTVFPISMIFFQTAHNFIAFPNLKRKSF